MSTCIRVAAVSAVLLGLCVPALGDEAAVKVTVREPSGLARAAEPASGGIPFKAGQVRNVNELVLVNGDGKPVPAQFSKLAGYPDGSVQWALVDLLVDLPASGEAAYTVHTANSSRPGRAAVPTNPLRIEEQGDAITVDTGSATFAVNTAKFTGLESAALRGRKVAGPGEIRLVDADGKAYTTGKPTSVKWEYRGPIRATLRVDGPYVDDKGSRYIDYTMRLTFWSGLSCVRADLSLRNSHPTSGFDAKIKEATFALNLPADWAERGKGDDWVAAGGAGGGVLVTHRHTAGCFPGDKLQKVSAAAKRLEVCVVPPAPADTRRLVGYGEGYFALADLGHKDSQIWLDFYAGDRDADGLSARRAALRSGLLVLADGAWIGETGTLTAGAFGTLADEIATYKAWGWKGWDDEKKLAPARKAHVPDAFVSKVDIHDESESDSVELYLLMYVRTGQRGFFDLAEAYARYYKGHAVWRTDGFEYDGFRHERAAVNQKSKRKSTALGHGWYSPKVYGWSDSRFHMCHQWATGLLDYYCLTGDVDALEAGLDWAEYAGGTYPDMKVGGGLGLGRAWGRSFGIVLRAWQVTGDAKWKALADTFGQIAVKAPNRDACGLLLTGLGSYTSYFDRDFFGRPDRPAAIPARLKAYMEEHGLTRKIVRGEMILSDKTGKSWSPKATPQSFEFEACCAAIARYAEATGDPDAKKLVVDLACGARDIYWSKKCEHAIPHPYIGFPVEGKVYDGGEWDDSHANCPGDNGGKHSGYHTRFFTDIFSRAYTASGDRQWLDWAKRAWNRGSKRGYWTTSQSVPDDVVAAFAGHSAPKGDGIDIRNCARLFYEVPRANQE